MAVEISNNHTVRLTPVQEIKLAKPAIDLYIGQILKTVVVTTQGDDQATININGQNINAKTAHRFVPGESIQVKVLQIGDETILQVLPDKSAAITIQAALAQNLPRQASAAQLFALVNVLENHAELSTIIKQQLQQLLASIPSLEQLPQKIAAAIQQSGLFLESSLLNAKNDSDNSYLQYDLKTQYLRLLAVLTQQGIHPAARPILAPIVTSTAQESLPLPGAIPQPQARVDEALLANLPLEKLLLALSEQATQVLSRIKTSQFAHLLKTPEQPYSLMLDLPVQTKDGQDVVSLMIEEEKQAGTFSTKWSVSFAIHLQKLGNIQGMVSLGNNIVDVQIHAQETTTLDLLAKNQQPFAELISNMGLQLGTWGLHQGLKDNHLAGQKFVLLDLKI